MTRLRVDPSGAARKAHRQGISCFKHVATSTGHEREKEYGKNTRGSAGAEGWGVGCSVDDGGCGGVSGGGMDHSLGAPPLHACVLL